MGKKFLGGIIYVCISMCVCYLYIKKQQNAYKTCKKHEKIYIYVKIKILN